MTSDAAGDFVVAWTSSGQDGSGPGVFGQRYDAAGAPRGSEFQMNTQTASNQSHAAVASDAAGNLVVVWQGLVPSGWDSFGQRFGGLLPAALAVDPSASAGSDGNGVLEPAETSVVVAPSWRNVNGAAQTFAGNGSSFTGPAASGVSYELTDADSAYCPANAVTREQMAAFITATFGLTLYGS